jgi:Transposase
MNDAKYIGLDVHQATISVAVLDSASKLVMEAILETKAETILQFIHGLRGSLHVTFEEGTCAAWLHDLLKPHVAEVLVCDSRKNASMKAGNKNDRADARKLAELLYLNKLNPVYHGAAGIRTLKELARSYLAITRDLTRVMIPRRDRACKANALCPQDAHRCWRSAFEGLELIERRNNGISIQHCSARIFSVDSGGQGRPLDGAPMTGIWRSTRS